MGKKIKKPPIGIIPKIFWEEERFYEVCAAITRYYQAAMKIPVEWIQEYNDFIDKKENET